MKIDIYYHLHGEKDKIVFEEVKEELRPVVRGRWISDDKTGLPICSVCHSGKPTRCFEIRFCYFCGADMREAKG